MSEQFLDICLVIVGISAAAVVVLLVLLLLVAIIWLIKEDFFE